MATPLDAQLQALTNSIRDLVQANAQQLQVQRENTNVTHQAIGAAEDYVETIVKGRKLNAKQLEMQDKLLKLKQEEFKLANEIRKHQAALAKAEKDHGKNSAEAQQAQQQLSGLQRRHTRVTEEGSKAAFKLNNSFRGLIKGVDVAGIALTYFGSALRNSINLAKQQMIANTGLIEGTDYLSAMFNQQGEAWKRGMDPEQFFKLTAENRQLINAMGGTTKTMDIYQGSLEKMYSMTGDILQANKLLIEQSTSLALKGIRPTGKALESFTNDVQILAAQTGMSAEAATAFYNSVHDDADSITLLRGARDDEREAIIKSQRAMLQNAIAVGMSSEQAREAAKMLNKMVAAKPLERIKQAAKMRAIAGALGIAGGDQAAEALMAGKRATAQQKEQYMQFQQNATNKVDQSAQQGMGYEIFATQLVDKLGLDNQYGDGSPFSTTLTNVMQKSTKDTMDMYAKASDSMVNKLMMTGDKIVEQLKQIASGTIVMTTIVSGFQNIFKLFTGEQMQSWVYDGISSAAPAFANAIGASISLIVDPITGTMNLIAGILGKLVGAITGLFSSSLGNFFSKRADENLGSAKQSWNNLTSSVFIDPSNSKVKQAKGPSVSGKIIDATTGQPVAGPSPNQTRPTSSQSDADVVKRSEAVVDATTSTADGIQNQLKKMDDNAALLKMLVENSKKQIELAEKQLVVASATDTEKQSGLAQAARKDNRFAAQYGYAS